MALAKSTIASLIIAGTAIGGTATVVAISYASDNQPHMGKHVVDSKMRPNDGSPDEPDNVKVIPSMPLPTQTPGSDSTTTPPTTAPNFNGGGDDSNSDDGNGPNGDDGSDDNYSGHHGHNDRGQDDNGDDD